MVGLPATRITPRFSKQRSQPEHQVVELYSDAPASTTVQEEMPNSSARPFRWYLRPQHPSPGPE
jgi:hypothetical protein